MESNLKALKSHFNSLLFRRFLETIRELNMEYRQANMKKFPKMLIFCNTKVTCNFIATQIKKGGMKAEAIHGGIGQQKRDFMMNGKSIKLLVKFSLIFNVK